MQKISQEQLENLSPLFRNAETHKFESCKMFNLGGINVPSDFNAAMLARGDLDIIDCPGKQYSYDTSNGIDSIVYQVKKRCILHIY